MNPERIKQIRSCCRDEEAFEELKRLLDLDTVALDTSSAVSDHNEERSPSVSLPTAEQYQSFFQVIAQIRESLDAQVIFKTTVAKIREFLHADRAGIIRFSTKDTNHALRDNILSAQLLSEDVAATDLATPLSAPKHLALLLNGVTWDVCAQSSLLPHAITNIDDVPELPTEELAQARVRAYLLMPLLRDERLWGVLYVHQCHEPRQWNSWEIAFVEQFAMHVDVALTQSELLRQVQLQTEQQKALFKVVTDIRKSLELNQIFKLAAVQVRQLLSADRTGIYKFDEDSGYEWGRFVSEDVINGYRSVLATPVEDRCFGENYANRYHLGQIQAVANVYDAGLQPCHVNVLAQFQVIANLVVPIRQGDRLWGLLCIHQCASSREWKSWEIEFVRQIAAHLGVALNQAELFEQTRLQSEELARTLENLKSTQTQLVQTEKMSSLGQLVAGVAHEINNPVNFIYGNLVYVNGYTQDLLNLMHLYQRTYPQQNEAIEELADEIELEFLLEDLPKTMNSMRVGAERIREIVLSLRNFARVDEAEMKFADIHDGLSSTLLILQHRFKSSSSRPPIEIICDYGDIPPVECYPGQLNQVFMNILANAVDALEDRYSRSTEGETAAQQIESPKIQVTTRLEDDRTVSISIKDNGPGISYQTQSRLFDPFFTTKPIGKGTGLGLSISIQIVTEWHKGNLECCSDGKNGTEFRIRIPLVHGNRSGIKHSEAPSKGL